MCSSEHALYRLVYFILFYYLAAAILPYEAFAFFLRYQVDLLYETKWSVADL